MTCSFRDAGPSPAPHIPTHTNPADRHPRPRTPPELSGRMEPAAWCQRGGSLAVFFPDAKTMRARMRGASRTHRFGMKGLALQVRLCRALAPASDLVREVDV